MNLNPDYRRVPLMTKQQRVPRMDSVEYREAVEFLRGPHVTIDPGAKVPFKLIYLRYVDWCEEMGRPRVSRQYLAQAMIDCQIVWSVKGSGYKRLVGVRINR